MFEALLKEHILSQPCISGMLAVYDGKPAVFHKNVPMDSDRGWERHPCYPRINYSVDMREDSERKASGALYFNVACLAGSAISPEDIESELVRLISGTFYTWDDNTVCVIWSRSDYYEATKKISTSRDEFVISGTTITFDVTHFPVQTTTYPDPILSLNRWIECYSEDIVVIGCHDLPHIFKPCNKRPAAYWRILSISPSAKSTFAVTWYDCQMVCHIISDDVSERIKWLKAILQELSVEHEILMEDDSPLFIHKLQLRSNADRLREGQLTLSGRYGVLNTSRKIPDAPKLLHAYFDFGDDKNAKKEREDHYNQSKPLQDS